MDFSSHFWRRSQESFEAEYLAIAAYRLFASERPRIAPSASHDGACSSVMKTSVGKKAVQLIDLGNVMNPPLC